MNARGPSVHPGGVATALAPAALAPSPERSVEELFRAHGHFVWRTLSRMGVREADLPDLLQEVFVIVQRKHRSFDGTSRATTWLFAIAARVAANHRRAARHRREALVADLPERPDEVESPEAVVARSQASELLHAAIDALPPQHRAVLVMYELEGQSGEEIASELGIPVGTVRSRLHHARKRVMDALPAHLRGKE